MKPNFRILVIDDEKIVCDRLTMELEHFDLVITDIKMRGPNGIEVMNFVKENHPSTKVIVITGFATVETAREVLKGGAVDFIPKPFKMSKLRELVLRLANESTGEKNADRAP